MPYKKLRIEIRNRVAYILLGSGQRFNKLTITTLRESKRAVVDLSHNPEAVCLVNTGHPGESFAVGADISLMAEFGSADGFSFAELGQSLFASASSAALAMAKKAINASEDCDLKTGCLLEAASFAYLFATSPERERMTEFLEGTSNVFG